MAWYDTSQEREGEAQLAGAQARISALSQRLTGEHDTAQARSDHTVQVGWFWRLRARSEAPTHPR